MKGLKLHKKTYEVQGKKLVSAPRKFEPFETEHVFKIFSYYAHLKFIFLKSDLFGFICIDLPFFMRFYVEDCNY
jgi:hypothetical protein